jgi:hypothetical protein
MVVKFVRQHWAQPGVTVTESKMLRDAVLGIDREVDIVVEGSFDGELVVTSLEVTEDARRATIEWAERLIEKHRRLPTNRLVLVSKSGFSKTALAAVEAEGGWVDAVTPEAVETDGQAIIKSLFVDTVQLRPTGFRLSVPAPDGNPLAVPASPVDIICDASGKELGSALELAKETLRLQWLRMKLMADAHSHPERDLLESFTCGVPIGALGYYLRGDAANEPRLVTLVEIRGGFSFAQHDLPFEFADLGGRRYGSAEAPILGQPAIWVTTTNEAEQRTTLSWRTKAGKPVTGLPAASAGEPKFPALLELQPPDWPSALPPGEGSQQAAGSLA